jgi:CBS domain-containing protein
MPGRVNQGSSQEHVMQRKIIPGVIDGRQALCCLPPTAMAHEAATMMHERQVGAVMVVTDAQLLGIVTERDLVFRLLAEGRDARATPLAEIMTRAPQTLRPDDSALDALDRMRVGRFRHLPVIDAGKIVGIVSIRDLYEAVRQTLQEELRSAESLIYGEQYGLAAT